MSTGLTGASLFSLKAYYAVWPAWTGLQWGRWSGWSQLPSALWVRQFQSASCCRVSTSDRPAARLPPETPPEPVYIGSAPQNKNSVRAEQTVRSPDLTELKQFSKTSTGVQSWPRLSAAAAAKRAPAEHYRDLKVKLHSYSLGWKKSFYCVS